MKSMMTMLKAGTGLKAAAGLVTLTLVLASCGSGVTPDGSGSVNVYDLKTEYRTQDGTYVACDNTSLQNGSVTNVTNVAVSFSLAGSITSVDVGLRGVTTSQYDGNYNATVTANQLADLGGNKFKTVFKANSVNSQFLPQSLRPQGIVVNPAQVSIKTVNAFNRQMTYGPGAFFASVTVQTTTGATGSGNTRFLTTIPVYSSCNVLNDTGLTL